MPGRASYASTRRPWWQRWLARLLALAALGGVAYGVVEIVRSGAEEDAASGGPALRAELARLAERQAALGDQLDALRPGRSGRRALAALRGAQRAQTAAVKALRKLQMGTARIADERRLQDALGAEFDYLDAVGSVLRNRRSPLLRSLGNRAERALEAFSVLQDPARVEDGIHGTTALTQWARARR